MHALSQADVDAMRLNIKIHGRQVKDGFLFAIMQLLVVRDEAAGFGRKKRIRRELEEIAKTLHLDEFASFDEMGQMLLCAAYRDAAHIFITLGEDDPTYGRGFLNIQTLSDEKFELKVREDFTGISRTVPEALELGELFRPFAEALESAADLFFSKRRF